jgi:hypothetical protein
LYTPSEKDQKNLDNNFVYHAPKPGQPERYTAIRDKAKEFALFLMENCPSSRELSVALTELETSVMWANAAIARNEKGEPNGEASK